MGTRGVFLCFLLQVGSLQFALASLHAPKLPLEPAAEIDFASGALAVFSDSPDWQLSRLGDAKFSDKLWSYEDQGSGVLMYIRKPSGLKSKSASDRSEKKSSGRTLASSAAMPVAKKGASLSGLATEEKRVVLREGTELNSAARYALFADDDFDLNKTTKQKTADAKKRLREESSAVLFDNGAWTALSRCSDLGIGEGRACLTVTPKLCAQAAKNRIELSDSDLDDIQKSEVRSISLLLTLRGSEHQLDNVVLYGNRMGLKDAAQTTKGRLLRIAKFPNFAKDIKSVCASVAAAATAQDGKSAGDLTPAQHKPFSLGNFKEVRDSQIDDAKRQNRSASRDDRP